MELGVNLKLRSSTYNACSSEKDDLLTMMRLTQCSNISPVQKPTSAKAWIAQDQYSLFPTFHSACCSSFAPKNRSMTKFPMRMMACVRSALTNSSIIFKS